MSEKIKKSMSEKNKILLKFNILLFYFYLINILQYQLFQIFLILIEKYIN